MTALDPSHIAAEIEAIRAETNNSSGKGKRLEALIATIFRAVPGLSLEDQDITSNYRTQEIDLYFMNERPLDGLHFLDCPLIVECKGWSCAVDGRELRYFATTLKDKGRRSGVFVALEGITGNADDRTAGFFHVTTAMAEGQTVLIVTGEDLLGIASGDDLVKLLKRRLMDQVKSQVSAGVGGTSVKQRKAERAAERKNVGGS
ncbi:restriction endonuclease [Pelagibius marinus]|uniref:restriction endonuclease n=1 Tax=Pelagibius marinus TaxID=2762760 RepID=UPI001872AF6E|nr:restriction endonuclease [Pelagibius marinus]